MNYMNKIYLFICTYKELELIINLIINERFENNRRLLLATLNYNYNHNLYNLFTQTVCTYRF